MDACPDDVDPEKWALEDLSYVAAHLGKHRACRLALAALEAEAASASAEEGAELEDKKKQELREPLEDVLLKDAFAMSADAGADAASFFDFSGGLPALSAQRFSGDDKLALLNATLQRLRTSGLPVEFREGWEEAKKARVSARTKLAQLEDLFEMRLVGLLPPSRSRKMAAARRCFPGQRPT